jgi:hypothetical protein
MDPERFLTAAVMWYNRFMLLAPGPEERQKSPEARRKFAEVGPLTLSKMTYYIAGAKTCQHDLEAKGLWQAIPERRPEFLRVLQLIDKCAFTLSVRFTTQPHPDDSRSTRLERVGRSAGEELRQRRVGGGREVSAGRRRAYRRSPGGSFCHQKVESSTKAKRWGEAQVGGRSFVELIALVAQTEESMTRLSKSDDVRRRRQGRIADVSKASRFIPSSSDPHSGVLRTDHRPVIDAEY